MRICKFNLGLFLFNITFYIQANECFLAFASLTHQDEKSYEITQSAYKELLNENEEIRNNPDILIKMIENSNPFQLPQGVQIKSDTLSQTLKHFEEIIDEKGLDKVRVNRILLEALKENAKKTNKQTEKQKSIELPLIKIPCIEIPSKTLLVLSNSHQLIGQNSKSRLIAYDNNEKSFPITITMSKTMVKKHHVTSLQSPIEIQLIPLTSKIILKFLNSETVFIAETLDKEGRILSQLTPEVFLEKQMASIISSYIPTSFIFSPNGEYFTVLERNKTTREKRTFIPIYKMGNPPEQIHKFDLNHLYYKSAFFSPESNSVYFHKYNGRNLTEVSLSGTKNLYSTPFKLNDDRPIGLISGLLHDTTTMMHPNKPLLLSVASTQTSNTKLLWSVDIPNGKVESLPVKFPYGDENVPDYSISDFSIRSDGNYYMIVKPEYWRPADQQRKKNKAILVRYDSEFKRTFHFPLDSFSVNQSKFGQNGEYLYINYQNKKEIIGYRLDLIKWEAL